MTQNNVFYIITSPIVSNPALSAVFLIPLSGTDLSYIIHVYADSMSYHVNR